MADVKKETQIEVEEKICDCEATKEELNEIKAELDQIKKERDQIAEAYRQLLERNDNIWGLYSTTIDYVVSQTTIKK